MIVENTTQLEDDAHKAHYMTDLARVTPNGAPAWLKQLRSGALARFRAAAYPHSNMEEWRQTNIRSIIETPFHSATEPGPHGLDNSAVAPFLYHQSGWTELVFVDGHFDKTLSDLGALPKDVCATGLREALHGPEADIIRPHLGKLLQDRSAFTTLNSAFLTDGAYLHVPKDTVLDHPVHLLFLTSAQEVQRAAHPRTLLLLDQGSRASVVVTFASLEDGTAYLNNAVEEIVLGEDAHLAYVRVVMEQAPGHLLATTELRQARGSQASLFAATLSGHIVRNQICVELAGEGAESTIDGLYLNDGKRLVDHMLSIQHTQPRGVSRIACKGILDGESKSVFLGKVHVHPEAQKTDSRQINRNLLLSDHASVETKPQLEIYADDVKCTHGATVGAPPQEVLFYFRSRGISEATARGMLTCGFAGEVLQEVPIEAVRDRLNQYVFEKYAPAKVR